MDRLTWKSEDGCAIPKMLEKWENIVKRLAEYEDIGMTPEELDNLCRQMSKIRTSLGFETLDDVYELVNEGRLVVLPCKVGDIENALDLIRAERSRQNSLWGDQSGNHLYEWMSILGEEYGELCEAVNETCARNPRHPERGGYAAIVRESVQIAAVAVQIIEANIVTDQEIQSVNEENI